MPAVPRVASSYKTEARPGADEVSVHAKLREIDAHFSEREEAKAVVDEYFNLCNHLQQYETEKVKESKEANLGLG